MWITLRRAAVLTSTTAVVAFMGVAASAAPSDLPAPTRTTAVTAGPTGPGPAVLVGVRVGRHDSYDRTVFDFTGGTPGYRVEYAPLYTEGRGDLVQLEGAATLAVHFHPAYAHNPDTGAATVDLRQVLTPRFPTLRQVKFGGDFEGYVSAGLGVADRVGFRVFTLANPYRVVVDVAHQPGQPFGTATVSRDGPAAEVLVTGVRAGSHPGYDRLVFDLTGTDLPTFRARYLTGGTIEVLFTGRGSATVSPHASFAGPATVSYGLPALRGVTFQVGGAGTMTATVATAAPHGFRVLPLTGPTRLALDISY
jgi:AMIN domain